MTEHKTNLTLIMSVPIGSWPASICTNSEEYYAELVERYPDYHFFIMEVKV